MSLITKKFVIALVATAACVLLVSLVLPQVSVSLAEAESSEAALHPHLFVFEVAENGTLFTPDEAPVFDDGMPAFGAAFITQGYIYPEGTLTCDFEGNCDGVLADGSPEFPDKVLGEWTCWGYHVSDGGHTAAGPMVATTQMYSFGDEPGAELLTTIGYEMADMNSPFLRSVAGGTGIYQHATGNQQQELLGLNNGDQPTFGVVLRVTFDLDGVDALSESAEMMAE